MKPSQVPKVRADLLRECNHPLISEGVGGLPARLANAELFLVTRDMTAMVLDASHDVPEQTFSALWPHPVGLMAFDGGLPRFPSRFMEQLPAPSVLTWHVQDAEVVVVLWARREGAGPIVFGDPRTGVSRELFEGCQWIPVFVGGLPHTEASEWCEQTRDVVAVFSLLLSAWSLMAIPTVAQVIPRTEAGAKLRSGKRDMPREVKVVDMRRLARKPPPEAGEAGEGKRVFTHQWVVRGHWRQQPVGPKGSQRRTTWIPSYLKGPEGAPFLPSETVFVWRR